MRKTADIEREIGLALQEGVRSTWPGWRTTLAAMEDRLPPEIRADDRRWIGVAVSQMLGDGRIRTTGCDDTHSHDGACVVEAAR